MPFIVRARQMPDDKTPGCERRAVLGLADTRDGRLTIDRWNLAAGHGFAVEIANGAVGWIEMQSGAASLGGQTLTPDLVTVLPPGFSGQIEASEDAEMLVSMIPDAARFDDGFSERSIGFKSFDWTNEPVLQSEHDGRKRIYLATEALFGTTAIKGEMIIYPPGATCPEHHHEGAEHYQYVLSGSGTTVLDGTEEVLNAGDLLYNFENERHWFFNHTDADFVFVEYFVPGLCKTVWAPEAKVCAWMPTGSDLHGRSPSRDIPYHSHGDGTPV